MTHMPKPIPGRPPIDHLYLLRLELANALSRRKRLDTEIRKLVRAIADQEPLHDGTRRCLTCGKVLPPSTGGRAAEYCQVPVVDPNTGQQKRSDNGRLVWQSDCRQLGHMMGKVERLLLCISFATDERGGQQPSRLRSRLWAAANLLNKGRLRPAKGTERQTLLRTAPELREHEQAEGRARTTARQRQR